MATVHTASSIPTRRRDENTSLGFFGEMGSGSSISRNSYEKKCGDEAFKLGNYQEAIIWYSVSLINLENSSQHDNQIRNILLSNRSAAYYMNKQYLLSLYDAKSVIELNSQWSKGYFRAAKVCYMVRSMMIWNPGV